MKNKEKFPNVNDAKKAFEEEKKDPLLGSFYEIAEIDFEKWLEVENYEDFKAAEKSSDDDKNTLPDGIADMVVGVVLGHALAKKTSDKEREKDKKPDPEKPSFCPFCGSRHLVFRRTMGVPHIICEGCGAYFGVRNPTETTNAEFFERFNRRADKPKED